MKSVIIVLVLGMGFSAFAESFDEFENPDLDIWKRKSIRPSGISPEVVGESESMALGDLIAATKLLDMKADEYAKLKKENGLVQYNTNERKRALRKVAVDRELISRSETGHVLTSKDIRTLTDNIEMVRSYNESLKDAPKIKDLAVFPAFDKVKEAMKLNRERRDQVKAEMPGARFSEQSAIQAWLVANEKLHEVWEHLYDAQAPTYALVIRRGAAKKLKTALGAADFAQGKMPAATAALPGEKR